MTVPASWMPRAKMQRIIVHWTAGTHRASANDRAHYHILIEADGKVVRGVPTIDGNAAGSKSGKKASHTLNCNTGSIGVSLCCMGDAVESPFSAGRWPMTEEQWNKLMPVLADLARFYDIPVTPKTVLSHAEVQSNLGIKQRGKWDIARLAFNPSVKGAKACGDLMRMDVRTLLTGPIEMEVEDEEAVPGQADEPKPLMKSKIAQGSSLVGGYGATEVVAGASEAASQVKQLKESAEDIGVGEWLMTFLSNPKVLFGIAIIVVAGLLIYWRWRDHGNGGR